MPSHAQRGWRGFLTQEINQQKLFTLPRQSVGHERTNRQRILLYPRIRWQSGAFEFEDADIEAIALPVLTRRHFRQTEIAREFPYCLRLNVEKEVVTGL